MAKESVTPSIQPTFQGPSLPTIPTLSVIPSSINYYYSTLANANLNSGTTYCQNTFLYVPTDWILAPDDIDSLSVITLNTWSTTTVVVASGVGYYSKSTFGSINRAYSNWLVRYYAAYGFVYSCATCNCEVLIMYSPYPTLEPSYAPAICYNPSPSIKSTSQYSSSGRNSWLYSLIFIPVFILITCGRYYLRYRQRVSSSSMPVQHQVQVPSYQQLEPGPNGGYFQQRQCLFHDNC